MLLWPNFKAVGKQTAALSSIAGNHANEAGYTYGSSGVQRVCANAKFYIGGIHKIQSRRRLPMRHYCMVSNHGVFRSGKVNSAINGLQRPVIILTA